MSARASRQHPSPNSGVDPVTVEVIGSALSTIVEEMGNTIVRSAFSTNIKERQDCSTVIFDATGRTLAQAERIPIHLGSLLGIGDYVMKHVDIAGLRPGDVFIGNDAHTAGGTHLNDIVFLEPVFFDGKLVAWVSNLAHHSDFVDRAHKHIFQEGLRIPPIRLYREGVLQQDVMDLVLLNCQVPHERRGDFNAQMAANRLGVKRYQALCEKYGVETLARSGELLLDHAESKTRLGLATIPNGKYAFETRFDSNLADGILDLKVVVELRDGDIFVDLDGNPAQLAAPINMVMTATQATVYFAVKSLVAPDVPPNAGFHRPIHISAPEGSVFNAVAPAAVYSRTDIAQRLVDMMFAALSRAIPERIMSACSGGALATLSGRHPRTGRFYVYNEMNAGGMGARYGQDGLDAAQVHTTNTANIPIEALEFEHPVMIEAYELVQDSGGPGQWRGGMTLRRRIRVLDHDATAHIGGTNAIVPPFGLFGGHSGTPTTLELDAGVEPFEKRVGFIPSGKTIAIVPSSGGGYGDPKKRDRDLVRKDLREGRISKTAAREIYGLED